MMNKMRNKMGFTILEICIAVTLMAIVLYPMVNWGYNLMFAGDEEARKTKLQNEARNVLESIVNDMRKVDDDSIMICNTIGTDVGFEADANIVLVGPDTLGNYTWYTTAGTNYDRSLVRYRNTDFNVQANEYPLITSRDNYKSVKSFTIKRERPVDIQKELTDGTITLTEADSQAKARNFRKYKLTLEVEEGPNLDINSPKKITASVTTEIVKNAEPH